jgi:UDP-N-acetylmuramoylalanine--D-glutamate ligase
MESAWNFMELEGKRFLVVGLGESGLAMTRWLHRQGADVRVADSRKNPPQREALLSLIPDVEIVTGPFQSATFAGVDCIALSPGVSRATPEIAAASAPVISEVDLFTHALQEYQPEARILAITGTNGKTTTTALTAHLLNSAGIFAVACGNISPSLLDALMAALKIGRLPDVWVLELSSFQLETTHTLNAHAATVLNVCEDHLDRHAGCFADYANAKARIFQGLSIRIVNRDDDRSLSMGGSGAAMITFGLNPPPRAGHYGLKKNAIWLGQERLVGLNALSLKGLHNAANVMAALALCATLGVGAEKILGALKAFRGLPHRVETVAEHDGIVYVDDSKGTNVGATLAAISGMGRPVAIILGGDGKGQDFSPLTAALKAHGRAVALIGKDASAIAVVIKDCGLPMTFCSDMAHAVSWLAAQARSGDCVLLSPACASWDMYRDYAHRAEAFIAAVRQQGEGA